MFGREIIPLLTLASVLLALPAEGEPVVWRFEGVVTLGGFRDVQPGDSFVGFVTFDSLSRVANSYERMTLYFGEGPAYGIEVRTGSMLFGADETQLTVGFRNNFILSETGPADAIHLRNQESFGGVFGDRVAISLLDDSATVLESEELLMEPPGIESFSETGFSVIRNRPNEFGIFAGELTDIRLAPEPRASIGLILALTAVVAISSGSKRLRQQLILFRLRLHVNPTSPRWIEP